MKVPVKVELLSETFVRTHRARLDAIGAWEMDPVEDEIVWREPEALRSDWVPFDLRFGAEVEDENGAFDPDEAMFALWEAYRPRHRTLVAKFRREAEELFADDDEIPFGKRKVPAPTSASLAPANRATFSIPSYSFSSSRRTRTTATTPNTPTRPASGAGFLAPDLTGEYTI